MTIKDFSTDRPAYLVEYGWSERRLRDPIEVKVVKVGRKIVTVRRGSWDRQFIAPEWQTPLMYFAEKTEYTSQDMLFPTMDAYNEWKERKELLEWFKGVASKCERLTTDQLRAIKSVLKWAEVVK